MQILEPQKNMSSILALITARAGSKGVARKNIRELAGKPLIAWTAIAATKAAESCSDIARLVVSTDSEEIAEVARQYGFEAPFLRPSHLAADDSSHISVVEHALSQLEDQDGFAPDHVLLLQPTSPLRTAADIISAIQLMREKNADVVAVRELSPHPYLAKTIDDQGRLQSLIKTDIAYMRRQSLPPAYAPNGAIYLNRRTSLLKVKSFVPDGAVPYIMPADRSIDIDLEADLLQAELLMKRMYGLS